MSSSPNCSVYNLDTDSHTVFFNSTKYIPFVLLYPMDSSFNAGRTISLLSNVVLMNRTFYGKADTVEDNEVVVKIICLWCWD